MVRLGQEADHAGAHPTAHCGRNGGCSSVANTGRDILGDNRFSQKQVEQSVEEKIRAILVGSARHKHAEKKLEQVGRQRTQQRQQAGRASKGVG